MMNRNNLTPKQINDPTIELGKSIKDTGPITCCICLMSYSKVTVERVEKKTEVIREKNTKIDSEFQEYSDIGSSQNSSSLFPREVSLHSLPSFLSSSSSSSSSSYFDEEEGQMNRLFFALHSCGHIMCTSCLASYCASKVIDGIIEIKCCHLLEEKKNFHLDGSSPQRPSETQNICKHVIEEEDILFLLNRYDVDNVASQAQWISVSGTKVIDRYQRFKFDQMYGETSRRCPDCDHPHIFDMVDLMIDQTERVVHDPNQSNGNTNEGKENSTEFKKKRKLGLGQKVKGKEIIKLPLENESSAYQMDPKSMGKEKLYIPQEGMFCIPVTEGDQSKLNIDLKNRNNYVEASQSKMKVKRASTVVIDQNQDEFDIKPRGVGEKRKIPKKPIVNCEKCDSIFCYYHSNAHRGKTCEQYKAEIKESEDKTKEYLERAGSKQCPNCGAVVLKDGGCNHMKCSSCDKCFCWLCLTVVEDTAFPAHFQWWNLKGCPNMQMREGEEPTSRTMILTRFLSFCQMLIIGPPTIVLSITTIIFCYCCFVAIGDSNRERFSNLISFWGNLIAGVLIIAFICTFGVLMTVAFVVVAFVAAFFLGFFVKFNSQSSDEITDIDETSNAMKVMPDKDTINVSNLDLTSQPPKISEDQLPGNIEKV